MTEEQWSNKLPALRRNWLRAVRWPAETTSFILYVPLRRKSHLQLPDGRTAGAIIENYPGDDHGLLMLLHDESTSVRLLRLIMHVWRVRLHIRQTSNNGVAKLLTDNLGRNAGSERESSSGVGDAPTLSEQDAR
jgi:hypothetical protein